MANVLKVAMQHAIITLLARGCSQRHIARELGVSRDAVGRLAKIWRSGQTDSKQAISTTGSTGACGDSKQAISTAGSGAGPPVPRPPVSTAGSAGRQSACEPFRKIIEEKVKLGLSAQRIWQDLDERQEFTAGYESVKRFVRRFEERMELPFRRMESPPGKEAQVDFGKGALVVGPDGKRTRPHLFRMVLSHSGAGYSEVVRKQDTETFIRCIENGFRHFGGVTETLVCDNLKAAVTKADWYDPEINPKMRDFCSHYGTVTLPTKPRTPRHKGKVEKSVDYAQRNALKGRTFSSLAEQNAYLERWERTVADTRIHGTTRRQVRQAFEAERQYLSPLPDSLFPCFCEAKRKVNRDGHIEVARAYYSVPAEHARTTVWARWDGRLVRIFSESFREVAVHPACEPGRFSTLTGHISPRKISGIERGQDWMIGRLRLVGPGTEAWARAVLINRGIEGLRVLQGLLSLVGKRSAGDMETACLECLHGQAFRLNDVRRALKAVRHQPLMFTGNHPLVRAMEEYGRLVPFPEKQ